MIAGKKRISIEHNDEMRYRLLRKKGELNSREVSLRKFIDINFELFVESGLTTREIYEFLQGEEGVDVGSFKVFKTLFSRVRVKRSPPCSSPAEVSSDAEDPRKKLPVEDGGGKREEKPGNGKCNPALPPVYLPDGTEVEITKTGAKIFQIGHSTNWKGSSAAKGSGKKEGDR